MKNIFFFIGCIIICCPATGLHAQAERVWSSYYGKWLHSPGTSVTAVVVDKASGFIYVAGTTIDSSGIASPNSFKSYIAPTIGAALNVDIFLAKFDTVGNRMWGTYYGGSGVEFQPRLAIDPSGNVYLSGYTFSDEGIATPGSHLAYPDSVNKLMPFLVKFNPSGQRLWGTYYGAQSPSFGNSNVGRASGLDVACDGQGNVFISGSTANSVGFSTPGAYQTQLSYTDDQPRSDGYLAKFDSNGVRQWGTYYGGRRIDAFYSLFVDKQGDIYAYGSTQSADGIASPGADQPSHNDTLPQNETTFIVKFSNDGQRLWATYSGGNKTEMPATITGDSKGSIYVNGFTTSTSGIATANSYQDTFGGGTSDMYLMKYDTAGHKQWGTYYGGEAEEGILDPGDAVTSQITPGQEYGNDRGHTLALDGNGDILAVGGTRSLHGIQKGCNDAYAKPILGFMAKFRPSGTLAWGNYYDAIPYGLATGGTVFYITGQTTFDDMATPNVFMPVKESGRISGLIAKFDFTCATQDFNINVNGNTLSVDSGWASYQWFKNDQTIANANDYHYDTGSDTASYFAMIADSCGCTYSSDTVNRPYQTAINTVTNNNLPIEIYPNPNNGSFTLSGTTANIGTRLYYTIKDITGRTLQTASFVPKTHDFHLGINAGSLANGLYLIQFNSGDKQTTLKFVKDR